MSAANGVRPANCCFSDYVYVKLIIFEENYRYEESLDNDIRTDSVFVHKG